MHTRAIPPPNRREIRVSFGYRGLGTGDALPRLTCGIDPMATAQAASEPQLGFPTKGSLRRFPFPRLIREIARAHLTGSLYLLSGQTKKVVFFEAGQPVFVRSNVLSECLGQVLAQEGLITQEQCEQTLEAIRRTGKKQGELLVEMGILSQGNLRYGLQAQLRAKLFDIFGWDDGRYQFKPDAIEETPGVRLDTTAEGVILAAIQDRYPEERARAALRDGGGQFPTLRGNASEFATELGRELSLEESFFVAGLDGSRTLDAVLQHGGDPAVPCPAALLYGLVQAGGIVLVDGAQPARSAPVRPAFRGGEGEDDAFTPAYEAQDVVTEYEDTPLPGELPKIRALLGDHEAEFAGVEDEDGGTGTHHSVSVVRPKPEVPESLVAAEPASVEETFEDAIDFGEDESFDGVMPTDDSSPRLASTPESIRVPEPIPELLSDSASGPSPLVATPEPLAPMTTPAPGFAPLAAQAAPLRPIQPAPMEPPRPATRPSTVDRDPGEYSSPGSLTFDLQPDDIETFGDSNHSGRVSASGVRLDPDATVLDVGQGGLMPPVSTDGIGHDLLADDELDSIHIGQADLDGLELDPANFGGVDLQPDEVDLAVDDDLDEVAAVDDAVPVHDLLPEDLGIDPNAIDDDLALDPNEPLDAPSVTGDLMGFDDLDGIDLGDGGGDPLSGPARHVGSEATFEAPADPEMLGAVRFSQAETALGQGEFVAAVALLEEAYESGFDVAELHAMLAYARFEAANHDPETGDHALELLDYAQTMDPSLDMVHAYRGAIYRALGQPQRAREALDRALELNPYCELAMQIMDTL